MRLPQCPVPDGIPSIWPLNTPSSIPGNATKHQKPKKLFAREQTAFDESD
jgi:hypothetical protein